MTIKKVITAGPGQIIGMVPHGTLLGDPGLVGDGLVGHWVFDAGPPGFDAAIGPPRGECPFCHSGLFRPGRRPVGRVAYRIQDLRVHIEVMVDLLPATHEVVGCWKCRMGFTWPHDPEAATTPAPVHP